MSACLSICLSVCLSVCLSCSLYIIYMFYPICRHFVPSADGPSADGTVPSGYILPNLQSDVSRWMCPSANIIPNLPTFCPKRCEARPSQVSTIHRMAAPENQQELLSFMGLANYMGPFIQNLSSLSAPLRGLTNKYARYQWSEEHQEAFEAIKAAISEHTTLAYFDTTQPITLQVDASMKGLGASTRW